MAVGARPSRCLLRGLGLQTHRSDRRRSSRVLRSADVSLNGEGVVFRGAPGTWFNPQTKQFHLDEAAAQGLVELVIEEYRRQHGGPPKELFIHASSNFGDEEWVGFERGAGTVTKVLGIQISDAFEDLKLYRMGEHPTIRGTALPLSERSAYLWTSGFVPRLDTYMGRDTAGPDHGEDSARGMRPSRRSFRCFGTNEDQLQFLGLLTIDCRSPSGLLMRWETF